MQDSVLAGCTKHWLRICKVIFNNIWPVLRYFACFSLSSLSRSFVFGVVAVFSLLVRLCKTVGHSMLKNATLPWLWA